MCIAVIDIVLFRILLQIVSFASLAHQPPCRYRRFDQNFAVWPHCQPVQQPEFGKMAKFPSFQRFKIFDRYMFGIHTPAHKRPSSFPAFIISAYLLSQTLGPLVGFQIGYNVNPVIGLREICLEISTFPFGSISSRNAISIWSCPLLLCDLLGRHSARHVYEHDNSMTFQRFSLNFTQKKNNDFYQQLH